MPRRSGEDGAHPDQRAAACGSWVLTRTHEKGAFALDFDFARATYVEMYAVLVGCGLELSRESHLRIAELCHCTKNLIETRAFEVARIDLVVYDNRSQTAGDDPSMILCAEDAQPASTRP